MQSQSQEKCSQSTPQDTETENYSLESLKLLYEGAKETQAFFNGPAYAQQRAQKEYLREAKNQRCH